VAHPLSLSILWLRIKRVLKPFSSVDRRATASSNVLARWATYIETDLWQCTKLDPIVLALPLTNLFLIHEKRDLFEKAILPVIVFLQEINLSHPKPYGIVDLEKIKEIANPRESPYIVPAD